MGNRCVLVQAGEQARGTTGLTYAEGISAKSAGAQGICLELATLPPAGRGRAHLHEGHESAAYVLQGELVLWSGDQLEQKLVAHVGDFVYIPAAIPHLVANASATDAAVAVLARTDANEQESTRLLPLLDDLPHVFDTAPA